jgi:hypothetical protein
MMRFHRRQALAVIAAAPVLAATVATAAEETLVDYLFVQNAARVVLTNGELRLSAIAPHTLYFSDRPERIVGRVTTAEFVDHWATGDDSFKADPPNAVLSITHEPEPLNIALVLKNPRLVGADLLYDVEVIEGTDAAQGGAASLFIDEIGRPLTPLSFAGVARRTSRRTARRVDRRN